MDLFSILIGMRENLSQHLNSVKEAINISLESDNIYYVMGGGVIKSPVT